MVGKRKGVSDGGKRKGEGGLEERERWWKRGRGGERWGKLLVRDGKREREG